MKNSTLTWLVVSMGLTVLLFSQSGCDPTSADASSWREIVAVEIASVAMATPSDLTPTPDGQSKCSNCNGTGRVKTGDGISTTECDECGGDGFKAGLVSFDDPVFFDEQPEPAADIETVFDNGPVFDDETIPENGTIEPETDELERPQSQVFSIPAMRTVSVHDGPPIKVQAADGGWREIETPGQAVAEDSLIALAAAQVEAKSMPPDAEIYPEPDFVPQPVLVPVDDTALCGPGGCSDGSCAICRQVAGSSVCASCAASYDGVRVTRRMTTHMTMHSSGGGWHLGHALHSGDGPIRRALRGEGRLRKAWRKRRGLFRGFRGCGR